MTSLSHQLFEILNTKIHHLPDKRILFLFSQQQFYTVNTMEQHPFGIRWTTFGRTFIYIILVSFWLPFNWNEKKHVNQKKNSSMTSWQHMKSWTAEEKAWSQGTAFASFLACFFLFKLPICYTYLQSQPWKSSKKQMLTGSPVH